MKYQYQVYNKHMNIVVTVPVESEEYAEKLAKRVAMDYYSVEEEHTQDLKVAFICTFLMESVINVNLLQKDE